MVALQNMFCDRNRLWGSEFRSSNLYFSNPLENSTKPQLDYYANILI